MNRAQARGWAEQPIGLSIPKLPFLADDPPPCADNADTFALAADDSHDATRNRANRRRVVAAERAAKTICNGCPALTGCRRYALTTRQRWGVWGGTNPIEREAWAQRNRRRKGEQMNRPDPFDNVPTIELFNADALKVTKKDNHDTARKKSSPAVTQGNCPGCLKQPAAIISQGAHLVWRPHTYKTWGGDTRDCIASGVALCAAPEPAGKPYHAAPAECPHGTTPPGPAA